MPKRDPSTHGVHLTKQYHRDDFKPNDFQWSVTEIADDFTLYDVFKLIALAERVTPGIAKTFGMEEFDTFWTQINKDRDPDYEIKSDHLELYWKAECDIGDDLASEDPTKSELSGLMSFHGVGPGCICKDHDGDHQDCKCPETRGFGIEFTPVNNLAHLPIRVSPNVHFCPPFIKNEKSFRRTGFQLTIAPTLWCLITSIFWELTFVDSSPDKIAKNSEQIFGVIKGIQKKLEETDRNIDFLGDLP